jgi:LacI family transcriptional regulator
MAARRRPAQMKDIAERAGVSISTVSHIVNNTRPVSPQTRERVLAVMRELSYYKNLSGRRLARGRSDSFGLIISDIENPFFPALIKSYEAAARERGHDVLLCATNYDRALAANAVRRMIENKVQGVAVLTSQLEEELVEELVANEIPVVRLDHGPAGRSRSNIRVDYSVGASEAARHLAELGHRDIALIAGPQNRVSAVTFHRALVDALECVKLPRPRVVEGDNTLDGGANGIRELLRGGELPTAVICGNDLAAFGAIRALTEAGLRVPEDVSVIGADDVSYASYSSPALTTIRMPRDRLGKLAFEALERSLRNKRRSGGEYVLEVHLVIRQSTGVARGLARRLAAR